MLQTFLMAYGAVAALLFMAGLASSPRPKSAVLVGLAAALWPVTMGAIAVQAWLIEPADAGSDGAGARAEHMAGQPRLDPAAASPSGRPVG
jgi:hypothetical protein